MKLIILLSMVLLVGCDSKEELAAQTKISFDNPEYIGIVSGKKVYRATVYNINENNHTIYFVDDTITVNSTVREGKYSYNKVVVLINGKPVATNVLENP